MPPRLIGPYRIEVALGRGGVGTVYRARDRRDGRHVALKMLTVGPALEPLAAKRLAIEFEALAELDHPNVVRVLDAGVHDGYPYLALELVEGLDLRSWLTLDCAEADADERWTREELRDLVIRSHEGGDDSLPWYDQSASSENSPARGWNGSPRAAADSELAAAAGSAPEPSEPSISGEAAAAGQGLRELKALAWAADEPDTEELGYAGEVVPRLQPGRFPGPAAQAVPLTVTRRRPIDLDQLNQPARVARLRAAAVQLCDALAYIHGRGLVHRDIKPANVMVDDLQRVRLMDFGLAKFMARTDIDVTVVGRIVGTYRYVAPELLRLEPVDGRADLYSLGVTLYELACGVPPFDADNPKDLWRRVLETEAVPIQMLNPGVDRAIGRVAHRLLRKEPRERFQTAEEVAGALQQP